MHILDNYDKILINGNLEEKKNDYFNCVVPDKLEFVQKKDQQETLTVT